MQAYIVLSAIILLFSLGMLGLSVVKCISAHYFYHRNAAVVVGTVAGRRRRLDQLSGMADFWLILSILLLIHQWIIT